MKVYLMANDWPGCEVAKFLLKSGDTIERLYLHEPDKIKFKEDLIKSARVSEQQIYQWDVVKDSSHLKSIRDAPPDFIITVFWSHLLKHDFFGLAKNTLNFHLALLPVNRGWYPHVHSIIDGSSIGVTLHQIDKGVDTGHIWAQKEIFLQDIETAYEIYHRLQKEIVSLFREKWDSIKNGRIVPKPQIHSNANYHKITEINQLDHIDLSKHYNGEYFLNLLRARSFGTKGFAFVKKNGKKIYLNLRLSETSNFK